MPANLLDEYEAPQTANLADEYEMPAQPDFAQEYEAPPAVSEPPTSVDLPGISDDTKNVWNALKRGTFALGQSVESVRLQEAMSLDTARAKAEEDLKAFDADPAVARDSQFPSGKAHWDRQRQPILDEISGIDEAKAKQPGHIGDLIGSLSRLEKRKQAIPSTGAVKEFYEGENWVSALLKNPIEVTGSIIAESLPQMAPGMAATLIAGPAGGAAVSGLSSFAMESANAVLGSLQQQGADLTDEESIKSFFGDPEKMAKAREYAVERGLPIGIFDAATAGLAGRILKPALGKGAARVVAASGGEVALQASGGAIGEAGAQFASEGKITDLRSITAEAIAEVGSAFPEVAGNLRQDAVKRATYKLRSAGLPVTAAVVERTAIQRTQPVTVNFDDKLAKLNPPVTETKPETKAIPSVELETKPTPKYESATLTKPGESPDTFNGVPLTQISAPNGSKVKTKFFTAQGSEYIITEDGQTRRIKSAHANTLGADTGLHEWNQKSAFLDGKDGELLNQTLGAHDGKFGGNPIHISEANGQVDLMVFENGAWRQMTYADAFPKGVSMGAFDGAKTVSAKSSKTPAVGSSILEWGVKPDGRSTDMHPGSPVSHVENGTFSPTPKRATVSTGKPNGARAEVEYDVIEADDLKPLIVRAVGDAQTREREGNKASDEQIAQISTTPDTSLLGESPTSTIGAPILDDVVLAGNGRASGLIAGYDGDTEGSKAYREFVTQEAARLGLDASSMKNPVLVRRVKSFKNGDRRAFVTESNPKYGALQETTAEAALLDADAIGDLSGLEFTDAGQLTVASEQNVAQKLADAQRGVQRATGGRIDATETTKRVQLAGLAKLARDSNTDISDLSSFVESDTGKRVLGEVVKAAPQLAQLDTDLALGPQLISALKVFNQGVRAVSEGRFKSVEEWHANRGSELISDVPLSPSASRIVDVMVAAQKKPTALRSFLSDYLAAARNEQSHRSTAREGGDIFGQARTDVAGETILSRAIPETAKPAAEDGRAGGDKGTGGIAGGLFASKVKPAVFTSTEPAHGRTYSRTAINIPSVSETDHGISEQLRAAWSKLKDGVFNYVFFDAVSKETGIPVETIAEQLKSDWLSDPSRMAVQFQIDRMGNNVAFRFGVKSVGQPMASYTPKPAEPAVRWFRGTNHRENIFRIVEVLKRSVKGVRARVVTTEADLPADVRALLKPGEKHEGLVDTRNGDVWLFTDHISTPARAAEVFAHEVIGHFGVEKIIDPKEWARIADSIFERGGGLLPLVMSKNFRGREVASLTADERATVAREYVATLAEQPAENPTLWEQVVAAVRKALRSLGIVRGWSEVELQALVSRGAKSVQEDGTSRMAGDGGIRGSRVPAPGEPVEGARPGEYRTRTAQRDKGTLGQRAWEAIRSKTTVPDAFKADIEFAAGQVADAGDLRAALDRARASGGIAGIFSGFTPRRMAATFFVIQQEASLARLESTDPLEAKRLGEIEESAALAMGDLFTQGGKILNIAGQLYAAMPMTPEGRVRVAEKMLAQATGGTAAGAEAETFIGEVTAAIRAAFTSVMQGQSWQTLSNLEMVQVIARLAAEGYAGKLDFEFSISPVSPAVTRIALPELAGMRESLASMLAKGLEKNWWQALAGSRAPHGPLTQGVLATQNQLAGILRQVMEVRKLVNKEQAAKLTDAEKVARFIGKQQLTEEAVAKLDEAVSADIEAKAKAAIEAADDSSRGAVTAQWAAIRDAWEEATSQMKSRPASNATIRRMLHAEAKEAAVDWDAEMESANDVALAQKLAAGLVERVKARTSGETLTDSQGNPFPALDLDALRAVALAQAQTIVAARRLSYTERQIAKAQAELNRELVSAEYAKQSPEREAAAIERAHSPIIAPLNLTDPARKAVRDLFSEQWRANPERSQALFVRDMQALGVSPEASRRLWQIATERRGIRDAALRLADYKRQTGKTAQRAAISAEMKALGDTMERIMLTKPRETWDAIRDELISKALARLPFATVAERDAAADALMDDMQERMTRARGGLLNRLTGTKGKQTGDKLWKLFELGALDDDVLGKLFQEKAGVEQFTPEFTDRLRKLYEEAEALPEGMLRRHKLNEIAWELALANPHPSLYQYAIAISYGNILGALSTQLCNNPIGALTTSLESVFTIPLSNKGQRWATMRGALSAWAGAFPEAFTLSLDALKTGENFQKVQQFDAAMQMSPTEFITRLGNEPGGNWTSTTFFGKEIGGRKLVRPILSQYRWIGRFMNAVDALFRWPARNALSFAQAAHLASTRGLNGLALNDAVDALNYPGGRQAALDEVNRIVDGEAAQGLLKNKADRLKRKIELLEARLSPEASELSDGTDDLANFAGLLNDQPDDTIGYISDAFTRLANPPKDSAATAQNIGNALKPFIRFVRTSANGLRLVLDYSLGYGAFRYYLRNTRVGVGDPRLIPGQAGDLQVQQRVARAYIGLSMGLGLLAYFGAVGDDDDPWFDLTGSGPKEAKARKRLWDSGWRPNAVKIGDTYWRYTNSPLAGVLGVFGRLRDNRRWPKGEKDDAGDAQPENLAMTFVMGIADAAKSQSFTRGTADLLALVNGNTTGWGQDFGSYLGSTAANFVPGNLRGIGQIDEILNGPKNRAEGLLGNFLNGIALVKPNGTAVTILGDSVTDRKPLAQRAAERTYNFATLADDASLRFVLGTGITIPNDGSPRDPSGKKIEGDRFNSYMEQSGKRLRAWLETEGGMATLNGLPENVKDGKGKTTYPRRAALNQTWKAIRDGVAAGLKQ